MNQILNVHLLPDWIDHREIAGHLAIVVDVLRASTTVATALNSGATCVVPCLTVEEARKLATQRPGSLLGGERQGKKLPGFDLGNSPLEYTRELVSEKTLVFTTTNGTKALTRCMGCSRVLIGCIANRAAVCQAAHGADRIDVICAGTNGELSMDDVLAAGAIVSGLPDRQLNDGARLSLKLWQSLTLRQSLMLGQSVQRADLVPAIRQCLAESLGGRNLIQIGMESDLAAAAELDGLTLVPELDRATWEIKSLAVDGSIVETPH